VKIADIYANGRFALSFEIFPPKTAQGLEAVYRAVAELAAFKPGFVSCTYGAGGSTRDQTLEIVTTVRDRLGVTTTAHFTCVGSTVADIRAWLTRASELGVENIMALRGDPPQGEESFKAVAGGFAHANELVALIRSEFPRFGIGVAGYPETHQEATSPADDLANLKRKVDSGADAVFTQLFYDNDDFFAFRDRCRSIGIELPIVPGLLPILRLDQIQRITSLCKAKLPRDLVERLAACENDLPGQMQVGIDHATRQCEGLLRDGVPGIHFYVLNRSEATCQILGNVASLLPKSP
jgi:methylenetetrahydrofolate reductase (NADPH)